MNDNANSMDVDDALSETDTWIYDEQDLDSSGALVDGILPLQSYVRFQTTTSPMSTGDSRSARP